MEGKRRRIARSLQGRIAPDGRIEFMDPLRRDIIMNGFRAADPLPQMIDIAREAHGPENSCLIA